MAPPPAVPRRRWVRGGGKGRQSVLSGAVPNAKGSGVFRQPPTQTKAAAKPLAAGSCSETWLRPLPSARHDVTQVLRRAVTCPLSQRLILSLSSARNPFGAAAHAFIALIFGRGCGEMCEFSLRLVEGSVRRGKGAAGLWGCSCRQRTHQP